jgi:hypothetical protein
MHISSLMVAQRLMAVTASGVVHEVLLFHHNVAPLPETDIFLSAINFPVRPEVDLRITGFPVFWSAHRKKD